MGGNVRSDSLELPVALAPSMEQVFNALLSFMRQNLRVRRTWYSGSEGTPGDERYSDPLSRSTTRTLPMNSARTIT